VLPIRQFVLFYNGRKNGEAFLSSRRTSGVGARGPLPVIVHPSFPPMYSSVGCSMCTSLLLGWMEVKPAVIIAPTPGTYIKKNMHICKEFRQKEDVE
jgi:hypothetical protein